MALELSEVTPMIIKFLCGTVQVGLLLINTSAIAQSQSQLRDLSQQRDEDRSMQREQREEWDRTNKNIEDTQQPRDKLQMPEKEEFPPLQQQMPVIRR